jgi:hypothetical protein
LIKLPIDGRGVITSEAGFQSSEPIIWGWVLPYPYPMADRGFWTSKSPLKGMFQPSSCWFDPKNSLSLILAILKCRF